MFATFNKSATFTANQIMQIHPLNRTFAAILYTGIVSIVLPLHAANRVDFFGYSDCIRLENDNVRVTLGHHAGGRVLEYTWKGTNAIWLDPDQAGWIHEPGEKRVGLCGGRFDIGPEKIIPRRDKLWLGAWKAEIIGPRAVRLTSQPDHATGVQLIREFRLAKDSSHLSCRQIIHNVSEETKYWCHWSRTFAEHGGVGIIPLSQTSKLPFHYVMYEGRGLINARPKDPNIKQIGDYLLVQDVPQFPKLGFDSMAGWFAYQMKNDLLFVKKYAADPDGVYNEVAGLTISIWYPQATKVNAVELEPIGPRNIIPPGGQAEFTEHWHLLPRQYQRDFSESDLQRLSVRVRKLP